jgi:cell division septation protein DedD
MVSVLELQQPAASVEDQAPLIEAPQEFEFVLGRRQVASLLFVSSIVLMICIAASYVAGKSMSPRTVAAASAPVVVREPDPPPIVMNQEPVPVQAPPVFATPKAGSVYIQMGAVEKGVAVIFAEGLRSHGLASFVAPGPSEKIFRVLIGPLPDPAAYTRAKEIVDQIGLSTFARRFPN